MRYNKSGNIYQVYLEKGESVVEDLTSFLAQHNINNGLINGIGAVKNVVLGSYDLPTKKYHKKSFENEHELITYNGNIMLLDGKPFIHAHATIGNHNMQLFGGHVFEMEIAVVGEFIIQKIDNNAKRTLNEAIGLAIWDLKNE
jgi:predicted DNA-binding protein with PD1-like motif